MTPQKLEQEVNKLGEENNKMAENNKNLADEIAKLKAEIDRMAKENDFTITEKSQIFKGTFKSAQDTRMSCETERLSTGLQCYFWHLILYVTFLFRLHS